MTLISSLLRRTHNISILWKSGQVCMANSRIYVQDTIADRFIALFKEKFGAVQIGNLTSAITNHGPVADEIQYNTVTQYIQSGKRSGKLVLGGDERKEGQGYFVNRPSSWILPRTRRS
jgi:acyl-CoA reductase-like NAD-dependent aldehyde dehydrogenase